MVDEIRPPGDAFEADIRRERLRHLLESGLRAIPFNVINALIITAAFWHLAPRTALAAWLGAMVLCTVVRIARIRIARGRGQTSSSTLAEIRGFLLLAALNAGIWSAGYLVLAADAPAGYRLFYLLMLGGLTAGAFSSMLVHTPSFLLYMGVLLLPPTLSLLVEEAPLSHYTALVMLLFMAMMALTHHSASARLIDGMRLRLEKERLARQLEEANRTLAEARDQLQTLADTDELTGLPNRRRFARLLAIEWQRAQRRQHALGCLMIDIDHFKGYNDRYGHPAGDECLRQVARILRRGLYRPGDLIARYGGEEFVALLPETPAGGAREVAERLRRAVEQAAIPHLGSPAGVVTLSIGVAAALPLPGSPAEALVASADEALYRAKDLGRNRVCGAVESAP